MANLNNNFKLHCRQLKIHLDPQNLDLCLQQNVKFAILKHKTKPQGTLTKKSVFPHIPGLDA